MMIEPYPEKRIQQEAIAWLREVRGYEELFSDVEATGARMDSVGVLDGRAIAIEVKPSVSSNMVRHRSGASGSIEAKIAATLLALAAPPPWLSAFKIAWKPSTYPTIAILAERYTADGLDEMKSMLSERALEWQFAFEVWQWTGAEIVTVASNTKAVRALVRDQAVSIPELTGSVVRRKPPAIDEFLKVAHGGGLGPVLSAFLDAARSHDLRLVRKVSGIGIARKCGGPEWATAFVVDCDAGSGMNVGVDLAPLGITEDQLPGTVAPKRGHMRCNRWIAWPEEAADLVRVIAERRKKGSG